MKKFIIHEKRTWSIFMLFEKRKTKDEMFSTLDLFPVVLHPMSVFEINICAHIKCDEIWLVCINEKMSMVKICQWMSKR